MTQEQIDLINKVVWFIPFKNKRNAIRNFLNSMVENINIIQSQNQQITDLTQHKITDLTQHITNQNQQITDLTQHITNQNQQITDLIKRIKIYETLSKNNNINNLPFIRIYNDDSEENLKNRKIVEDVLIENTDNQSKYDLHNYFIGNKKRAIDKWLFYFDAYEKHFSRFRGKDINLLEIGVQNGGSLQMWKYYFKSNYPDVKLNLYGIDIDEKVKSLEDDDNDIKIFIGSQSDREFLQKIKKEIPKLDILIDDGGHTMEQQIVTFEEMYEHVKDDGVYLCEDTHTSYFSDFGGGYHNQNTFIEYAKNLIDDLHSYWFEENIPINSLNIVNSTHSINFYDSMVFFEKKVRNPKYNSLCGRAQIGKCTVIDF